MGNIQFVQVHQFHPDSQEKQEWILELSFGNAGPSSQANLYKSIPRSAFKSMSLWMNHGVQGVPNQEMLMPWLAQKSFNLSKS